MYVRQAHWIHYPLLWQMVWQIYDHMQIHEVERARTPNAVQNKAILKQPAATDQETCAHVMLHLEKSTLKMFSVNVQHQV